VNGVQDAPARPLGGVGWIIAAYFGGTAVAVLLLGITQVSVNSGPYNVLGFLGLWTGFIGVPVLLSKTRGSGRLSTDFGLRLGGPADVGLGLLAGLASYGVVELYSISIRAAGDHANLGHEANQLSGHGLGLAYVAFGLCAAVGAPIAEEILFRGLTQPVLQSYLGGIGGLLATSVLFGFAHVSGNPVEALPALAFFGAVVGLLAWRTGRLGPGIVAHITFNGITVIALASSR
jgi:hypothetical protein